MFDCHCDVFVFRDRVLVSDYRGNPICVRPRRRWSSGLHGVSSYLPEKENTPTHISSRPVRCRFGIRFRGLPYKQKMRARSIRREPAHHVYQTCSKKRRLPAQEIVRRHARLTRSQHTLSRMFLNIDGPHLLFFFLSLFRKGKTTNQTQTQKV